MSMIMETELSKVRVDNEMDYCSVSNEEIKTKLEKAFLKERVSYFLRWETPGFLARLFKGEKERVVFCINSSQFETAEGVIKGLGEDSGQIRMIQKKSKNKTGF